MINLNKLRPEILQTMENVGGYECARGFLRYEMIRTLNIEAMQNLHERNIKGESFDEILDEMLVISLATRQSVN